MNYESFGTKNQNNLIIGTVKEFVRAMSLIEDLTDAQFQKIGAHFRHNLDFANAFLNGLAAGKIDYEKRDRNEKIEQNRHYAIEQIIILIQRFQALTKKDLEKDILVRSEVDAVIWHKSSVMRELEFLHSHTVHHHALVAEKISNFGVKVSADFGVAPSTLKFWESSESTLQRAFRRASLAEKAA